MRRFAVFATFIALLVVVRTGSAQTIPAEKQVNPTDASGRVRLGIRISATGEERSAPGAQNRSLTGKHTADEEALRETARAYVAAFSVGDAKSAAAQFTEDAEYVDPQGVAFEGRRAIEDLLTAFFANYPERKLELTIDSIRFIGSNSAIEDGSTLVTYSKEAPPQAFHYTAVHTKTDGGNWLTASVRERPLGNSRQHRTQLKQLEWLLGDWVHEGADSLVRFSCHAVDNGNFLVRKFTVHVAGQETMSGTQRIGWDPRAGKFRAWVFDSDGGYSDGYWDRDGDQWILRLVGITPEGQPASCTSLYSSVDARTMTFRSIEHEVGGAALPDSPTVTVVRQPPQAELAE